LQGLNLDARLGEGFLLHTDELVNLGLDSCDVLLHKVFLRLELRESSIGLDKLLIGGLLIARSEQARFHAELLNFRLNARHRGPNLCAIGDLFLKDYEHLEEAKKLQVERFLLLKELAEGH